MKAKFITIILILGGLLVTANVSYAWTQPPEAILKALRQYVIVGRNVLLDGSDSYDPDAGDKISKYEWDFNINGIYDYWETASCYPDGAFDGITTHPFDSNGTYTILLRVTDSAYPPHTDTDTCMVHVGPDSDNDGLPHNWEDLYDLNDANFADADIDSDSDNYNNLCEYLHGSEPNNSNSWPDPNFHITIYVPDDVNSIQRAIDAAIDGDTIVLAKGIYTGHPSDGIDFGGKAITLRSTDPNDFDVVAATVIDCEGSSENKRGGFWFHSGETNTSVLEGLTIKNAYHIYGAAIYCCNDVSPKIANCIIMGNTAEGQGAGIYCDSASPTIINCVFSNNVADSDWGGGLANEYSNPDVINCIFVNNSAPYGGGMENINSSPTVLNCIFYGNRADVNGGGVENYGVGQGNSSDPNIINCIFWANVADTNDQISNDTDDGGLYDPTVAYCDVQGGYTGTGNINSDPNFLDANDFEGEDDVFGTVDDGLRLLPCSPCIDAGDPNTDSNDVGTLDLCGSHRIADGDYNGVTVIDMGPYELPHILYVDIDANGSNNGTSWANAYTSLQSALSNAHDGDEIWVTEGTYKPGTSRSNSFQLVEGVGVYGGFAGTELSRHQRNRITHETILSGDIGTPNDQNDNSYHVVKGANNAVLDGFTVTGGNASSYSSPDNVGGGIYCSSKSPTIKNCTIIGNKSYSYGGGIYFGSSSSIVSKCMVANNESGYGGGVYSYGGAPILISCVFSGNTVINHAHRFLVGYGGAMYNYYSLPFITNCTFSKNTSPYGYCGGMYSYYSSLTVTNCIFWADSAKYAPVEIGNSSSEPTITYCDVQGGYSGKGNINSNPHFQDPNNPPGDDDVFGTYDDGLRLDGNSPCIDSSNGGVAPSTDAIGLERIDIAEVNNTGVGEPNYTDMGAYESYDEIDSDSDGIPDDYEILNGLDPDSDDANLDKDGDGLTNKQEFDIGTWANGSDTDRDGMDDGWEYKYSPYLDPLDKSDADEDPDGDTKSNLVEYNAGTNPLIYTSISVTIYQYNNAGDIVKETTQDGDGNNVAVTEHQYDELGRKWQERRWANVTDQNSTNDIIALYAYDVRSNLQKTVRKGVNGTDPNHIQTQYDLIAENFYNALGRLTRVKDPCDGNTYYTYYKGGEPNQVTDPNGNRNTNYYDNTGRLQKVVDDEGHYRLYYYDSLGRTIKQFACDKNNNKLMQTRFEYNGLGNVTRRAIMASPGSTSVINTSSDMVVDYNYADSNDLLIYQRTYYNTSKTATIYYQYDDLGRRTKITDPCTNETIFTYDEMDRIIRQQQIDKNPLVGNNLTITTDYYYDSLGRVLYQIAKPNNPDAESDPSWQITTYYYDTLGDRTWEIRPDDVNVYYSYNALGQLTEKIADQGGASYINQTTEYGYDRLGRQVSITGYANGSTEQETQYQYDKLDRVTKITYPDVNDIHFEYSPAGKVTKRTDQRGIVTTYGYDGTYNMLTRSATVDSNTYTETFTYDGLGRTLTAIKNKGQSQISKTEFRYNGVGKITDTNEYLFDWAKKTITYTYDQAGFLASTLYPYINLKATIVPDWQGRIAKLQLGTSSLVDYVTYKYIGSRVAQRNYIYPYIYSTPDVNDDCTYNNLGRVTAIHAHRSSTDIIKFTYEYDPNTNTIIKQTYDHRTNDPCTNFTYDNLDRLTEVEYGIDSTDEIFTIDKLGNRDQVHVRDGNTVNYDIDNLTNRYDSVGGSTLTYDAAGNLTKDKNGYTYRYDYENRVIKIKKSNDTITVAEFTYDALGRRIEKKDNITEDNTRRYYYNYNWQILSEYNTGGTHKRSYVYGNYIDEVLMSFLFYTASQCKYYLHDHLYSPVAVTDYYGQTAERYEYDAYGKCYILEPNFAPDPDGKSDVGNPFYFTGREMDTLDNGSLKIQYNRNRYYDYYAGRWLVHDPFGIVPNPPMPNRFSPIAQYEDGVNLYEYADSNPVLLSDPYGLECDIFEYRNPGFFGHAGILARGWDFDFGPVFEGGYFAAYWGVSPWPYGGPESGVPGYKETPLKIKKTGRMYYGKKCCGCVTCREVITCIIGESSEWNGDLFVLGVHDCRAFVRSAKKHCCLTE